MTGIERTSPMRINANMVVYLLRREWEEHGDRKLLYALADKVVSNLTRKQLLAIATGKAKLVGVTPGPIEYVEEE